MVSGSERPCYEHYHSMSGMLVLAFNLLKYHVVVCHCCFICVSLRVHSKYSPGVSCQFAGAAMFA